MAKELKQVAMEWFERGDRDIETAQLLYDERGYTDVIAYHIQQAIEKYLKGYLVLNGQRPPWVHELDTLLNLVSKEEVKADLDLTWQFVKTIREKTGLRGHRNAAW